MSVKTLPVFVSPTELTFYVSSQTTHKQILTVYNPYEFPVKYQAFTNATDKYAVVDPMGSIAPLSQIDLLIRHSAPFQSNCHAKDRFLITMSDATTNKVLGKRYIPATLLPGEKDSSSIGDDSSHSYTAAESSHLSERAGSHQSEFIVRLYAMVISIVCILALALPTKCDPAPAYESRVPQFLHLTVPVKIAIAFVLGMITMTLIRVC